MSTEETWIKVEDRLPKEYEDVEVRAKGESTWISYMYPNKTWMNNEKPTHWKPLPQSVKELLNK